LIILENIKIWKLPFAPTGTERWYRMSLMATPFKHPKTGIYYFRRQVPADIKPIIKKSEWKKSLATKELSEARPRFAAASSECEEQFKAAREQLAGIPRVLSSDSPTLAARWAASVVEQWDINHESINEFIVNGEPACHFIDENHQAQVHTVERYIQETLTKNHLPMPSKADPAFNPLVQAFFTQWWNLCNLAVARMKGDWSSQIETEAATRPIKVERERLIAKFKAPKLSEVFQKWIDEKLLNEGSKAQKTINDYSTIINRFIELFGDLPVNEITRGVCQEFRALLAKFPARGQNGKGLSAEALMAMVERDGLPTIKKQLRFMSSVLSFAVKRLDVIKEEPIAASGMLNAITKAAKRSVTVSSDDKQYTRTELVKIFSSPLFTSGWKPPKADFGKALYWLPLIMLYTGARREEVAQLLASNITKDQDSGIWCISIQPSEDQSVKTSSSIRKVPIHDDLIALGFLTYHQTLSTSDRLFPKLQPHPVNGFGHAIGKAWGKYLDTVVQLDTQASPSHGFRHTFKTICREVCIETAVSDWITGHATQNVGATYGTNPLKRMYEELKKFPSIATEAGLLPKL